MMQKSGQIENLPLPGERILVLGMGSSGQAAAELAASRKYQVCAIDEASPDISRFQEQNPDIVCLQNWHESQLPPTALIVISPGLPPHSRLRQLAEQSPAALISEIDFASRFAGVPILAVTGTNGKTTVVELTAHVLHKLGYESLAAGNIGYPLSRVVMSETKPDVIVAELSSFQLEHCPGFVPAAAALLNLGSDHLDRYPDADAYAAAKFAIFENVPDQPGKCIIKHELLPQWESRFSHRSSAPATFSVETENADWIMEGNLILQHGESIVNLAEFALPGNHNSENLMAALALTASFCPVNHWETAAAIRDFRIGQHRLELVAEKDGVRFINDSKATNPDAVCAAIKSLPQNCRICLIAGGLDKNMDFSPIIEHSAQIKQAFLCGEAKEKLASCWKDDIHCKVFVSFEDAVTAAVDASKPGDTVLLSPACASMDMFANYRERGERFREIIERRVLK